MKEIIIDGVNVAGCNKLSEYENGCDSPDTGSLYCDNNPNCLYKQLKRKEQENAELKAENEIARQAAKDFCKINEAYMKYEDCLKDIKAIAEEWINNDWSCFHCRSNMDEKLKEILDLITKAEEGE